jgi:thiosulfate dehydrogenase [quinone] large subunit
MNDNHVVKTTEGTFITNPPLARFLFEDTRMAVVWGIVRVLLGWAWLDAGLHKVTEPGWMVTGDSLKSFWARIVVVPDAPARPAIVFDWYRSFIQGLLDSGAYTWFAKLIAVGEMLVGVALIIGAFVGIAAFFGALMNWNFMLAGSASTNPLLFAAAILLILAWKTAGYYGVDRYLLPRLGTPWGRRKTESPPTTAKQPTSTVA